jgi:signal transduction histidine kinase
MQAVERILGEATERGRPGAAGLKRVWELFWSVAGAVPVRFKILGIALGMVLLLSLAIVITLWFTLPAALLEAQAEDPDAVMAILTRDLLLITAAASLVGIMSAYVLTVVLTRPILELVAAVGAVRRGDLRPTARVWARDEIGQLATAFNSMLESLRASRAQVEDSHREVLRRNRELAQLSEELRQKEQIRAQLLEKAISAQEEERKRIARELHDETSQTLTSVVVGLKVLEGLHDPAQIKAQVSELRDLAAGTLESVHGLALELRPSVLDDLGLVAAVQRHVAAQTRKYGLEVDFHTAGLDGTRLSPETETAVYRIIQEALANVARHSQATSASVVLERRRETLVAIVEDNGNGFDVDALLASEQSLGLHGMRERSFLVGGKLTVESSPGGGTTVFVQVPLAEPGVGPPRQGRGPTGQPTLGPDSAGRRSGEPVGRV